MAPGPTTATEVDARGMRCPWPALRLARAMRGSDTVRLLADDPAAPREVAALAAEHGWMVAWEGDACLVRRNQIAPSPSFPRKRESSYLWIGRSWIPAFARMTKKG